MYCATRWLGLATSTMAAVQSWGYLRRMKQTLIDGGYGPPHADEDVDDPGDDVFELLAYDRLRRETPVLPSPSVMFYLIL